MIDDILQIRKSSLDNESSRRVAENFEKCWQKPSDDFDFDALLSICSVGLAYNTSTTDDFRTTVWHGDKACTGLAPRTATLG